MTQDEIIEMARHAFACTHCHLPVPEDRIVAFAKLVAEREREACAKIADEWAVGWPHPSRVIAERIRAKGET